MHQPLPPIYPITDKKLAGKATHLEIVRELIRGGALLIQIRDKETPLRELMADLKGCTEYCARHAVQLVINDRCDLAMSCNAAGVHLGQDDLSPKAARRILGSEKIVGYSTHSLEQVRRAQRMPITYLGFGPVYATATKKSSSRVVGLVRLRQACQLSSRPVVAIGGIGPSEVREVLDAGADSAAVISALMGARNLARRMEELLKKATEKHSSANKEDRLREPDRVRP